MTEEPRTDGTSAGHSRALGVETVVVADRGQWAVEIIVFFADEVVRRRVDTCRTRRLADISARLIKRGAEREIGGPRRD